MAEEKEQLKIEATLDTSKLKQQAQQGMQSVVNEEKKVENQSNQTSKAIDAIGQSGKNVGQALQQAGSQGADALKKVGSEADKTSQKIDEIAKATKNINLGRAFGVASHIANSDFGRAVGSDIGNSLGMSGSAQGLAGGAITGALGGAAMGAAFGPIGAAGGALLGAASGLIQAANAQKEAARELAQSGEQRARGILNQQLKNELNKISEEEYNRIAANPYEMVKTEGKAWYNSVENKTNPPEEVSAIQNAIDALKWQMNGYEDQIQWAADALRNLDSTDTSGFDEENMRLHNASIETEAKAWEDYTARLEDAKKQLAAYIALQERLNNLTTGPELPDHIRAQRDAEEQAKKEAEAKAKAEAEARAREEQNRQKAFDSYTIEQKKEKISSLQDTQLKPLESMMSGMASFRLTDSLTRIGGGSGYGVQMQGISRYVSSISNNIQTIKGIIQQELDAIRELSNKYKPYYGEFMAQQDN